MDSTTTDPEDASREHVRSSANVATSVQRAQTSAVRPPEKQQPSLEELCERYREIERSFEEARSLDRSERARRTNELADQRRRVLSAAASRLPARGPGAQWFRGALEGAFGEPTQRFALDVVWHAQQFPKRYVEPVVRWALRAKVDRLLELASKWHGAVPVFDAMTIAVERGELGYAGRRFFEYYVRARPDEDPALVAAARARLREASLCAPDAPLRARDV